MGSLMYMMNSVAESGVPEGEQSEGMVSSLWLVATGGGGCLGSSLGGYTYDSMGFEQSTLVVAVTMGLALTTTIIFGGLRGHGNRRGIK